MQAIIDVYDIIKDDIDNDKKICIVSDSKYALSCVTEYGERQSINNWQKDIPNKELVKYGYELYKNQKNIYFMHIKAHTENNDVHSKGNNGADKLANKAIGFEECPYNSDSFEKIYLGRFPIMVQSNLCILKGLACEARFNMGECRNDYGGYFIIGGKEKVILSQEKFGNNLIYRL